MTVLRDANAPARDRGEAPTHQARPGGSPSSVANRLAPRTHTDPDDTAPLPIIDAAEVDEHLAGALVLLVRTSAGRHRRRVFLSVAAAQRAADRALQAGHAAEVILCRLEPVGAVL